MIKNDERKKICAITATRAEYGIMEPVLRQIKSDPDLELLLAVSGTHLLEEFGFTCRQIEEDGYPIDARLSIMQRGADDTAVVMAVALEKVAAYFDESKPDMLLLLGDRYEAMAFAAAAVLRLIPIAHIHGGEISEGAYDNSFRHCITKMSHLHFAACEEYQKRIIQMGEQPNRVFWTGAPGAQLIRKTPLLTKEELFNSLGWQIEKPFAVLTYHPVTLEKTGQDDALLELLSAIRRATDMQFLCTMANADGGGVRVNEIIAAFCHESGGQARLFDSLGQHRYYSAVSHSEYVIGNSSSGIMEVPSLRRPTINIGDREKGRVQAKSVINCPPRREDIVCAIQKARSSEMRALCASVENPYEKADTAEVICAEIKKYLAEDVNDTRKFFYDIDFGMRK
jgi:GDP/UDP-N,N'-diacetylbacillosamine 2-epimerase (hydrolysing)